MTTNPETLCRTCVTAIGWIDSPTGGWWAHETHPADDHDAVPGAWVDGDELMEAIAAEVWEHCAGEGTSLVVDDPRNIAGTAAAVARRMLAAPVSSAVPDHTLRELVAALAEDLRYVLNYRGPDHAHEQPGIWDTSGRPCMHCARLAVARMNLADYDADPVPPPADRATLLLWGANQIEAHEWNEGCDGVGCCADTPQDAAALLRRLAAEAQPEPAERRAYAWAQTIDTADGGNTIHIPGVHHSGSGDETVTLVVGRDDVPVLAAMLTDDVSQPACTECGHPASAHQPGEDPVTPGLCTACEAEGADDVAFHNYQPAGEQPEPAPVTPSVRAGLRDEIAAAIWERQNPGRHYADCEYRWKADAEADADAVLPVLYREWPWLRAEADDVPAAGVRQPDTETPCGPAPDQCDAEAGEPCADHERQQAHAEGEHAFCGPECSNAQGDEEPETLPLLFWDEPAGAVHHDGRIALWINKALDLARFAPAGQLILPVAEAARLRSALTTALNDAGDPAVSGRPAADAVPHTMLGAAETEEKLDLNISPLPAEALAADETVERPAADGSGEETP